MACGLLKYLLVLLLFVLLFVFLLRGVVAESEGRRLASRRPAGRSGKAKTEDKVCPVSIKREKSYCLGPICLLHSRGQGSWRVLKEASFCGAETGSASPSPCIGGREVTDAI